MAKFSVMMLTIFLALLSLVLPIAAKAPASNRLAAKKGISVKQHPKAGVAHGSISTPSPVDPFCKEFNSKCAAKCFDTSISDRHQATLVFKCKPRATHYYDFGCICDGKDITAAVLGNVANPPQHTTTVSGTTTTLVSSLVTATSSYTSTQTIVIAGTTNTLTTTVSTIISSFTTATSTITVPTVITLTSVSITVPTSTATTVITSVVTSTTTVPVTTTTVVNLSQAFVRKFALVQVKAKPASHVHGNMASTSPPQTFCQAYKESCTDVCGSVKVSSEICSYVQHTNKETYRLSCRCRDHTDKTFAAIDNIDSNTLTVTADSTATETVTSTTTSAVSTVTTFMTTSDITITSSISLTFSTTIPTTTSTTLTTPTTVTTSTTTSAPVTTTTSTTATSVATTVTGYTTITISLPTGFIGVAKDTPTSGPDGYVAGTTEQYGFYGMTTSSAAALKVGFMKAANGFYQLVDVSNFVGQFFGAENSVLGGDFSTTSDAFAYLEPAKGDSANGGVYGGGKVETGIWGYNLQDAGLYPIWTNSDNSLIYATVCNTPGNDFLAISDSPTLFAAHYGTTPQTFNLTFVAA